MNFLLRLHFAPLLAAFFAGIMGAFVGGGSLITIPSLIVTGLLPIQALASAKTIDQFSAAGSAVAYWRANIKPDRNWWVFAMPMLIGAVIGNIIIQNISNHYLGIMIPIVLMVSGLYFALSPHLDDLERPAKLTKPALFLTFLILGFYNGMFGPGIAVMMTTSLNKLAGYGLTRSVGLCKTIIMPANFLIFLGFAIGGHIVWPITLVCCVFVVLGTQIGARFAIKGGAKIIKPVAATLCIALSLKLLFF